MTHLDFITAIARSIRSVGAPETLAELRRTQPNMMGADLRPMPFHDTTAVFTVWAVDRLVAAGLANTRILWHPLTDPRSVLSWWDAAELATAQAAVSFLPSTRALPGEPTPVEARALLAA